MVQWFRAPQGSARTCASSNRHTQHSCTHRDRKLHFVATRIFGYGRHGQLRRILRVRSHSHQVSRFVRVTVCTSFESHRVTQFGEPQSPGCTFFESQLGRTFFKSQRVAQFGEATDISRTVWRSHSYRVAHISRVTGSHIFYSHWVAHFLRVTGSHII
jgi:hypothetical protein